MHYLSSELFRGVLDAVGLKVFRYIVIITHGHLKGIEIFVTTFAFWGVLQYENKMEDREKKNNKKED